jgi:hypothetical protein
MMRICIIALTLALAAWGADDAWNKVRDLRTGVELRIYEKDLKQPLLAKMADSTEDSLIVTVKNEEKAIPKDKIERIDYRPSKGSGRTSETTTTADNPDAKAPIGPARDARVPGTSSSSNMSFGRKADFETIYRRLSTPPHK